jgi:hypothetical protein
MIAGSTFTHSQHKVSIRKPFRNTPSGITRRTSTQRRRQASNSRCATTTLVINSTKLDRALLHSCATSKLRPGIYKHKQSRNPCKPLSIRKACATSVEARWSPTATPSITPVSQAILNPKRRGSRFVRIVGNPKKRTLGKALPRYATSMRLK